MGMEANDYTFPVYKNPEIVIAFVGAKGTDLERAEHLLVGLLKMYGYDGGIIRVSELFKNYNPEYENRSDVDYAAQHNAAIDGGNRIREVCGTADAVAHLAIAKIARNHEENGTKSKWAYIIHSLKTPKEIETFRLVYNELFYCVAIHAHRDERRKRMIEKYKISCMKINKVFDEEIAKEETKKLLDRDEHEGDAFGQDVRGAFEKADYYIGSDDTGSLSTELNRFLELVFDKPYISPTVHEIAMVHAYMAGLRSTDLSRQIGSAIVGRNGQILTTGCNDVPRPGGGQYWCGDSNDARDSKIGYDTNDILKIESVMEMLQKLSKPLKLKGIPQQREKYSDYYYKHDLQRHLKDTRADSILEFSRALHSERAAINAAAIATISIHDADLYCLTFPCHICAGEIIYTGIRNVFYIEAFPKSLTQELFKKAVDVNPNLEGDYVQKRLRSNLSSPHRKVAFIPFSGVAPRRYGALFANPEKRKLETGHVLPFIYESAVPRRAPVIPFHRYAETESKKICDRIREKLGQR
jgi:cytidine deaminase